HRCNQQVYPALLQAAICRTSLACRQMKDQSRIPAGEAIDDRGNETCSNCDGASDPQLPRRPIGEKFDMPFGLFLLLKSDSPRIPKRTPPNTGLHPPPATP